MDGKKSASERRKRLSGKGSTKEAVPTPPDGSFGGSTVTMSAREKLAARTAKVTGGAAGRNKVPSVGKTYRIRLSSDHFESRPGAFLDAHRSDKKDKRTKESSYAIVHDPAESMDENLAGEWLLEALDDLDLNQLPSELQTYGKCFRLKLNSGHFGCPKGLYLCGRASNAPGKLEKDEKKNLKRNSNSTWSFVQPLWTGGDGVSTVWTVEPVAKAAAKLTDDMCWKLRLVTEREGVPSLAPEGSRHFLEVHGSDKKDKRSDFALFANIHTEFEGCSGEWNFLEVNIGRGSKERSGAYDMGCGAGTHTLRGDDEVNGGASNPMHASSLGQGGKNLLRGLIGAAAGTKAPSRSSADAHAPPIPLAGGATPSIGKTYRIRLGSSHYDSKSGTYLDAHRSLPRDVQSDEASYVLVHDVEQGKEDETAGHWHIEGLTEEELAELPPEFSSGNNCFRVKLQTSHFGCPRHIYLCGVASDDLGIMDNVDSKSLQRNQESTWATVQPIWACSTVTHSIWTLEPADENPDLFKLRLVTERVVLDKQFMARGKSMDALGHAMNHDELEDGQRVFLEAHRSMKQDNRSPFSTFVMLHREVEGCVGEWGFEEVFDPLAVHIKRRDEEYTDESYIARMMLRERIIGEEESSGQRGQRQGGVDMLNPRNTITHVRPPGPVMDALNQVPEPDHSLSLGEIDDDESDSGEQECVESAMDGSGTVPVTGKKQLRQQARAERIEAKRQRYLAKKAHILELREKKAQSREQRRSDIAEARKSRDGGRRSIFSRSRSKSKSEDNLIDTSEVVGGYPLSHKPTEEEIKKTEKIEARRKEIEARRSKGGDVVPGRLWGQSFSSEIDVAVRKKNDEEEKLAKERALAAAAAVSAAAEKAHAEKLSAAKTKAAHDAAVKVKKLESQTTRALQEAAKADAERAVLEEKHRAEAKLMETQQREHQARLEAEGASKRKLDEAKLRDLKEKELAEAAAEAEEKTVAAAVAEAASKARKAERARKKAQELEAIAEQEAAEASAAAKEKADREATAKAAARARAKAKMVEEARLAEENRLCEEELAAGGVVAAVATATAAAAGSDNLFSNKSKMARSEDYTKEVRSRDRSAQIAAVEAQAEEVRRKKEEDEEAAWLRGEEPFSETPKSPREPGRLSAKERRLLMATQGNSSSGGNSAPQTDAKKKTQSKPLRPAIGKVFRIKLASNHFESRPGAFLDAHRSDKKDKRTDKSTFVLCHDHDGETINDQLAGNWSLQPLPPEDLVQLPPKFVGGGNAFRIQLVSGHYDCPAGQFLCGIASDCPAKVNKKEALGDKLKGKRGYRRNEDSTWCFVQPLDACGAVASSLWTLEPADGDRGEDGRWKLRLLTERAEGIPSLAGEGSRHFLEVHGSDKKDSRSDFALFAHVTKEYEFCSGQFTFHEV